MGSATFCPSISGALSIHNGSLTFVKFDVAVTAESADTTKGGGGFKVAVLSIGASDDIRWFIIARLPVLTPDHYERR